MLNIRMYCIVTWCHILIEKNSKRSDSEEGAMFAMETALNYWRDVLWFAPQNLC